MGIIVKMQESKFTAVEEGEQLVELEDIIEIPNGKFGAAFNFQCKIVEGEYAGTVVSGLVSQTLQPGNKLDHWLKAFGVNTMQVDEELDLTAIIGNTAVAYIVSTTGKKEGSVFNNIQKLRPSKKGATAAPKAAPAAVAEPKVAVKAQGTEINVEKQLDW